MSDRPNYHGRMKSAQATVDAVTTQRQAKTKISKALQAISKHEYIIKQEGIKIATYRKQITLLKEKFPDIINE